MYNLPVIQDQGRRAEFLSQSEVSDRTACGLKGHARWDLGHRPQHDENFAQRVGSVGHALLHERVSARFWGASEEPWDAVAQEAKRRGWDCNVDEEMSLAQPAVDLIDDEYTSKVSLMPNLYTPDGGVFAEVRLRVKWSGLVKFFSDPGQQSPGWRDVTQCASVMRRYLGIEGQPDIVCLPEGPGGPVDIVDYKFRQSIDLGGAGDETGPSLPDRQGSWYLALVHAAGLRPAAGVNFVQVNAYAGRWLEVDDFVRIARGGARSVEEAELVVQSGLPTRDMSRYKDAKVAVSADVWAEAHRVLAQARQNNRMFSQSKAEQKKAKDLYTIAEREGADRFLADLREQRSVVVVKKRADPIVCREVVRDMIVGVEQSLASIERGVVPARNLQTHRGSPCTRPGGCSAQSLCLASLGTFNVAENLHTMAQDGYALLGPGPSPMEVA